MDADIKPVFLRYIRFSDYVRFGRDLRKTSQIMLG